MVWSLEAAPDPVISSDHINKEVRGIAIALVVMIVIMRVAIAAAAAVIAWLRPGSRLHANTAQGSSSRAQPLGGLGLIWGVLPFPG